MCVILYIFIGKNRFVSSLNHPQMKENTKDPSTIFTGK
jgi:hypothetical protein